MNADLDLTQSIVAKSDQINADDLIAGPITVTISRVIKGSPEQPFDFQIVERPGRAYRPSKTMRRVIVEAWGVDATKYAGRRLTLYREPSITFGGQKVGGIRISHMSDIQGPVVLAAQVTKGKRETFTVQPLAAAAPEASTRTGGPTDVTHGIEASRGETPIVDRPADAATSPGMDTQGGSASEAAEPPEVSMKQSVEAQLAALTSHQKARLSVLCNRLQIKASRDGLIDAWGESCRDIVAMIDQVEARVTST